MNILQAVEQDFKKAAVVAVETGDTVRVHQKISEGSRERVQVFEGLVIRVDRRQSLTYRITVRKIASGVGVEKGFMMHSPNVVLVEVTKRAKVRRNYISYIRRLTGKSARLKPRPFDPKEVNLPPQVANPKTPDPVPEADSQAEAEAADQEAAVADQPADDQSAPPPPDEQAAENPEAKDPAPDEQAAESAKAKDSNPDDKG